MTEYTQKTWYKHGDYNENTTDKNTTRQVFTCNNIITPPPLLPASCSIYNTTQYMTEYTQKTWYKHGDYNENTTDKNTTRQVFTCINIITPPPSSLLAVLYTIRHNTWQSTHKKPWYKHGDYNENTTDKNTTRQVFTCNNNIIIITPPPPCILCATQYEKKKKPIKKKKKTLNKTVK